MSTEQLPDNTLIEIIKQYFTGMGKIGKLPFENQHAANIDLIVNIYNEGFKKGYAHRDADLITTKIPEDGQ